MLRWLPVEHVLSLFDAVVMLVPTLAAQRAALSVAIHALRPPKQQRRRMTAHDVVVAMIADGGFVQQLAVFSAVIGVLGNLVGCGLVALFRAVPGLPFNDPAMCCTSSILDDLTAARSME